MTETSAPKPASNSGCGCCAFFKCLCKPFTCLLGCLCSCLFKIICVIVVIIIIIFVILYFVFKPKNLKFEATDAMITDFNLDGNNLHYDMNVKLNAINPNTQLSVKYEKVEVTGSYGGERFAAVELEAFKQTKKATDQLNAQMKGQNAIKLHHKTSSTWQEEKDNGMFSVSIKVLLKVKFRVVFFDTATIKPRFICDLKVPTANSNHKFQATDCKYSLI